MKPVFRPANRDEVPAIIELLSDDILGAGREDARKDKYLDAFDAMIAEGNNQLIVGVVGREVVATYQLTFIPGLSLGATRRAQVEAVRVASSHRGTGLGEAMLADAESRARDAGCGLLQLTMNKTRVDARRFYERIGFTASHIGFKRVVS